MRHLTRPLLGVALGSVLLAGCGSGGDDRAGSSTPASSSVASGTPSSSAAPGSSSSTSPTPGSSAPASTGGTASTQPASAAWCTLRDLHLRLSNGNGAMGTDYYRLRMTNTSGSPCRTGGYGGVSLVGRPGGQPLGAPAVRTSPSQKRVFTLAPGSSASAVLAVTDAVNYPRGRCHPVHAAGMRVYPPDETHSVFLPRSTTACTAPSIRLMRLQPYAPVR